MKLELKKNNKTRTRTKSKITQKKNQENQINTILSKKTCKTESLIKKNMELT